MTPTILMAMGVFVLLILLIVLMIYQLRTDTATRVKLFELQTEMAIAQQATTKELSWSEWRVILNEIISFTIKNYIVVNGVQKMNDNEITLTWTTMLNELCTKVEMSMSDEMKRQILKTISIEYMSAYIKDSVQLILVYSLQTEKGDNKVNSRITDINTKLRKQTEQGQTTNKK